LVAATQSQFQHTKGEEDASWWVQHGNLEEGNMWDITVELQMTAI
jgi:hypothetical protein